MQTYDHILKLRAVRTFALDPIADDDLRLVLEAARWTGSAKNLQAWTVIVVTDPDQKDRLAECGDFTGPIRGAPAALALVQEPEGYEFDTGRIAQNVMLAADAIGLATCPITMHHEERAHEVLDLPVGARCRYAIAIGYPAPSHEPARFGGRKPFEDLVRRDRY